MEQLDNIKERASKTFKKLLDISFVSLNSSTLIIRTKGEYNMEVVAELSKVFREVLELGFNQLVLDCTRISYISSTGVGLLLEAHKLAKERKGVLVLFGVVSSVYSVLHLLGFTSYLNIVNTEKEALNKL